jgi:hypothetical protein
MIIVKGYLGGRKENNLGIDLSSDFDLREE